MNASFNRRLGCSPYYKMYLRAPKLPLDSFDPMTREKINSMSFSELLEALESNWKSGQKKTDRYLQIENASRTSKPIEVNSYCYIYYDVVQIGLSKKLQSMWIGPCLITKVISECLYEVLPLSGCKLKDKSHRIIPRDKIYVIESTVELTPDEKIGVILTDEFFSVDPIVKIPYDFPQSLHNLSTLELNPEEETSPNKYSSQGPSNNKVRRPMFDNHDLGMPGLGNNLSNFSSSEDLDVLIEDLSKTLDNTHVSDNYVVNKSNDSNSQLNDSSICIRESRSSDSNLQSNVSIHESIRGSRDSVFENTVMSSPILAEQNNSQGEIHDFEESEVNMQSIQLDNFDSRMDTLDNTYSDMDRRLSRLENRRESVKRSRNNSEDELDRSMGGVKTQKMSETLFPQAGRGRPKGTTQEVLQNKLDKERENRDRDRIQRFSNKDVFTRRMKNLVSSSSNK
ncbi:MAG: hypothetical protein GY777_11030 [Candidatus Brocadiaceae bacterium]|nr:hypothetical protein [Candidatus Brocadiaceae bacterium]